MTSHTLPQERGAYVKLAKHADNCEVGDIKKYVRTRKGPLAIDLFCGAGGLSLGLEQAGFDVILGVDHNARAIATHAANFGGASEIADLADPLVTERLVKSVGKTPIDLIAGGPPCQPFSRAGENKIRSLVANESRSPIDTRRDLWQSFMYFVESLKPRAVLVENVPDMASGKNAPIFKSMLVRLENLGYHVHTSILKSSNFGVPQHRERLIVVALSENKPFSWPSKVSRLITVGDAIDDLPLVDGGDLQDPKPYNGPNTVFQEACRIGVNDADHLSIYDHITRPVRGDDREAFRLLKPGDLYTSLPATLRRYRSDTFNDKYNRLDWKSVSRTITAHIAKDGYWYIHPNQDRTLTVREAARIQTFPDRFRFVGHRTSAFRQIGDAVPPILGTAVGKSIRSALTATGWDHLPPPKHNEISEKISDWFAASSSNEQNEGFYSDGDFWSTILAISRTREMRANPASWDLMKSSWPTPKIFLADTLRYRRLKEVISEKQMGTIARAANYLQNDPSELTSKQGARQSGIPGNIELAFSFHGVSISAYPNTQVNRVAGRLFGYPSKNGTWKSRPTRLALQRATASRDWGQSYRGLYEIGLRYCKPSDPQCDQCPLSGICITRSRQIRLNGDS